MLLHFGWYLLLVPVSIALCMKTFSNRNQPASSNKEDFVHLSRQILESFVQPDWDDIYVLHILTNLYLSIFKLSFINSIIAFNYFN